jgi:hypothetical protein
MKLLQVMLAVLLAVSFSCIVGCTQRPQTPKIDPQTVIGKIVDIQGTMPYLMKSPGVGLADAKTKVLILIVETASGKYVIEVDQLAGNNKQTLYSLTAALKVGDTIKFPIKDGNGQPLFSNSRIGVLHSDVIEIVAQT